MSKQEITTKSKYTEEEEDFFSGIDIPTGVNNLYLRNSGDVDTRTPLSEDFMASPLAPSTTEEAIPIYVTAFFAYRGEDRFIVITENEVDRNIIDQIRMNGWVVELSVPDNVFEISEVIGLMQFSERFCKKYFSEEPSIHKFKEHKDDDQDDQNGDSEEDFNTISQLLISVRIDNNESSGQTQTSSSSTQSDISTSQAVLAISVAMIGSVAYYAGGYSLSNLDSNPFIDSFKNSFLEQVDYYL